MSDRARSSSERSGPLPAGSDGAADVAAADDGSSVTATEPFRERATVRDRVWDATLTLIAARPLPFQVWRVRRRAGLDREQDRTIRRTLRTMAAAGWLTHEDGSQWWYPGPKADRELHVDAD